MGIAAGARKGGANQRVQQPTGEGEGTDASPRQEEVDGGFDESWNRGKKREGEGNEKEESLPLFSVMSRGSASKRAKSSAKHPTQQPAYEYYDDDSFIDEYSLVVSITRSEEDDYYGEKPKRKKDKTKAPKKPKSRFAEWTPS